MVSVLRFRSVWGVDGGENYEVWNHWFPSLKAQGYAGVETTIAGRQQLPAIRSICDKAGLEIIVLYVDKFYGWPDYEGPKPVGRTVEHHLEHYRKQLEIAKVLRPVKINAHSGDDQWSVEQSVEFFRGTLKVDTEVGLEGRPSAKVSCLLYDSWV
ncbi:Uncharacterized protein TPAR_06321 [Tolypocladium paradoxum]|uniref:Xylose isomerase-like TIM barrel domain-containing protein n=1 Tax=Tolypocladium paradoxum TaxID=94208 RepID=A0A2S4KTH7_9HYPO|nr:Uncharacterized protein TPAR_06321 [Tolypocladium paradoxum]